MKQAAIRRVLIIGAGTMGLEIAWQCASYGYDVVIYDAFAKALISTAAHVQRISYSGIASGFERLSARHSSFAQSSSHSYMRS